MYCMNSKEFYILMIGAEETNESYSKMVTEEMEINVRIYMSLK